MTCPLTIDQIENLIIKGNRVTLGEDGSVTVHGPGIWTSEADQRRMDDLAAEVADLQEELTNLKRPSTPTRPKVELPAGTCRAYAALTLIKEAFEEGGDEPELVWFLDVAEAGLE
jgi:hypothetical protein